MACGGHGCGDQLFGEVAGDSEMLSIRLPHRGWMFGEVSLYGHTKIVDFDPWHVVARTLAFCPKVTYLMRYLSF